jgi:U4/U6.U5 tri-snRNP-associated protein 2
MEKNPTIVNFPIKGLDMTEYIDTKENVKYDLIANICHEGEPEKGIYRVHVLNKVQSNYSLVT